MEQEFALGHVSKFKPHLNPIETIIQRHKGLPYGLPPMKRNGIFVIAIRLISINK